MFLTNGGWEGGITLGLFSVNKNLRVEQYVAFKTEGKYLLGLSVYLFSSNSFSPKKSNYIFGKN